VLVQLPAANGAADDASALAAEYFAGWIRCRWRCPISLGGCPSPPSISRPPPFPLSRRCPLPA